jgi:Na+/proline symporter
VIAPQTTALPSVGGATTVATMAGYFVVLAAISVWAARRTKTSDDFFVAGRRMGTVVLGIAAMATTLTGFTFIAGPGLFYSVGATALFIVLPASLTNTLGAWTLARPLHRLGRDHGVITIPGAIGVRYDSRAAQGWAAAGILVAVVGYIATNFLALGYVLDAVFGTGLTAGVWIGAAVMFAYTAAGGMLAGMYADVFQGIVKAVASVAACVLAIKAGGGLGEISATIMAKDPEYLAPFGKAGALSALSYFFVFGIGSLAQPHVAHKYLMARDLREFRWYPMVMTGGMTLALLIYLTVGLAVKAMVVRGDIPALDNQEAAMSIFLEKVVPPALAGLVFAGITSAIMSAVNAFLSVGSAAIMHDLPKALGRSSGNELKSGRWATVGLAVAAALVAQLPGAQVVFLGVFAYGLFASTLIPALAIGLNWKRGTRSAAVASIIVGLVVTLVGETLKFAGAYSLPAGVPWSGVALVLSLVVYITMSVLGGSPAREQRSGAHASQ